MFFRVILPPLIVFALITAYFSLFKVQEWEKAVLLEFGEIKHADFEPGLHFMVPIKDTVAKFDIRLQSLDQEPQHFFTVQKKQLDVDYYVKWRISDVKQFYRATKGNTIQASNLLAKRINGSLREEFGKREIRDVVAGERSEIMDIVTTSTSRDAKELGISVEDMRIKQIELPDNVSSSVYKRMRAERERIAADHRARGSEAAERIEASADRERKVILANAYRDAETIRGEGDAQATEIYASAFGKDEEFYTLYRSLNAYQTSFGTNNDILLLEPDSDFFKYFNNPKGR